MVALLESHNFGIINHTATNLPGLPTRRMSMDQEEARELINPIISKLIKNFAASLAWRKVNSVTQRRRYVSQFFHPGYFCLRRCFPRKPGIFALFTEASTYLARRSGKRAEYHKESTVLLAPFSSVQGRHTSCASSLRYLSVELSGVPSANMAKVVILPSRTRTHTCSPAFPPKAPIHAEAETGSGTL